MCIMYFWYNWWHVTSTAEVAIKIVDILTQFVFFEVILCIKTTILYERGHIFLTIYDI